MLSEKTAKEAKPTDKPQKLPHEKGLYLYISPKGGKSWRFDYRFADVFHAWSAGLLSVFFVE